MKFIEFKDASNNRVLINPAQIIAVYQRGEVTEIYCTDSDGRPYRVSADYDTVRKLLGGARK